MSSGLVLMAAVDTASADDGNNGHGGGAVGNSQPNYKVFVCKYVTDPKTDEERLQTGDNPISVSINAINHGAYVPADTVIGQSFSDRHDRSLVIAVDTGQPEPSVANCAPPRPPSTINVPTLTPSGADCDTAGSLVLPVVAGLSFKVTPVSGTTDTDSPLGPGTYSITVTSATSPFANDDGGDAKVFTYPNIVVPAATPPCPSGPTTVSPSVSFDEPTCENPNAARINLGSQDKVNYGVMGAAGPGLGVTVKATPKAGFEFAAGAQTEFSHKFKTIQSLNCPSEQPTVVPTDEPTVGGTQTTRPRPDNKPKPKPNEERPPAVLGTQAGVPSAVAAGLPGTPTSGGGSSTMLVAQLMVGAGLVLLVAGGWTGLGARRGRAGTHQF